MWLRTTTFGDEKDRVIVRETGAPTYFAADLAYLEDKLDRGFDRLITPLGADHHGYVARMKAAMAAAGADPQRWRSRSSSSCTWSSAASARRCPSGAATS